MDTLIISFSLAFFGILINIYGFSRIKGIKAMEFLSRVILIKTVSNLFFIIGWLARIYESTTVYAITFMIAGTLILILAIVLFWGVHKEIYIEKTELTLVPIAPFLFLNQVVPLSRLRTLMLEAFGSGLVFIASMFAIYGCYKLYKKRKGGALIWVLIAFYALAVLFINTLGFVLTMFESIGVLDFKTVIAIHLSSLIIPDSIAAYSAYYYSKRIKPIIEEISLSE
ncbi:MAG: hypothetical protein ACTSVW_01630 [Candidatus Njordarchaeales archaeon]